MTTEPLAGHTMSEDKERDAYTKGRNDGYTSGWNDGFDAAKQRASLAQQAGEAEGVRAIVAVYDKLHEGKLGAHWLWVVFQQLAAGIPEPEAMRQFGYYEPGKQQAGEDARDGWISVDVLPKKGRTPILVAVGWKKFGEHEDGTPFEATGVDVTEGEYVPAFGERAGYFESYQGKHGDLSGVTHWRPLPPPPAIDQAMKGGQ